jgi:hypothetical protein
MNLDHAIDQHNEFIVKFNVALEAFVTAVQNAVDEYMKQYTNLPRVMVTMDKGPRYIRIVKNDGGSSCSVHSFVDRKTGDILKGSWKAPVKNGVRGSIFNKDPMQGMTHHGPAYLR